MSKIRFVDLAEHLDWLVDPEWEHFRVNAQGQKRDIMKWLEGNTTHNVVIHSLGKLPQPGDLGIIRIIYGDRIQYEIYFEDPQEAMHFKLAWK